jgi:hypothetical protein
MSGFTQKLCTRSVEERGINVLIDEVLKRIVFISKIHTDRLRVEICKT